MEYGKVSKRMKQKSLMINNKRSSIGADLRQLDADKIIATNPDDNIRRRTLRLTKKDHSWGFTLQTYGIKHKKTNEIEMMTYVDYVEIGGAAWMAGMRRGDVIISVNGEKVGDLSHIQLVHKIRRSSNSIRLVVLFEDCCRKVDLHDRFIKLKVVLKDKYQQLKELELKEREIIDNHCLAKGLNRFEHLRSSILSMASSGSDSSWDAYSVVSSPKFRKPGGEFPSLSSLKSCAMGDNSSCLDESYEESFSYIDSDSDSDSVLMDGTNEETPCSVDNVAMATHSRKKLICENISFSSSDSDKSSTEGQYDVNVKCENCDTLCENGCYGYADGANFVGRGKSGTLVGHSDNAMERRNKSGTITENDQNYMNGANCCGGNSETVVNPGNATMIYSRTQHISDHNVNTHQNEVSHFDNGELEMDMSHFGDSDKPHRDDENATGNINAKHKGDTVIQVDVSKLNGAMGAVHIKQKRNVTGLLPVNMVNNVNSGLGHVNTKGNNRGQISVDKPNGEIGFSSAKHRGRTSVPVSVDKRNGDVVTFHVAGHQVVYINERDEATDL